MDQLAYRTRWSGKGKIERDINEFDDADMIWRACAKERETVPDDIDTLLNVVNLKPLERKANMIAVKRCLGVPNCKDEEILPKLLIREMEATK